VVVAVTMKLRYVQTVLTEEEVELLLKKTGKTNMKDALRAVVEKFLEGK